MKLSLILEAIDRWSGPSRKAKAATDGLAKSTTQLERATTRAGSRMLAFWRDAERGEAVGRKIGVALRILAFYGFERVEAAAWGATKAVARFGLYTARNLAIGGVAAATGGLVAGLYKIVGAGVMFEKFRIQLTTAFEGSQAAANKALDWITVFARQTPYSLQEVTEGFIQLKSKGIDATDGSLRILGDTAGAVGKSLAGPDGAVPMITDAMTFQFERLREFGVTASQKGQQITLSWVKDGKNMTKVVRKNALDVKNALFGIFDSKYAGGSARLAASTEGKWQNLMDRLTVMAKDAWEGGFGASVNKQLDRVSAWIDRMANDGSLKRWADETSKYLENVVNQLGNADWRQIAQEIKDVANAFRDLASAAGQVAKIWHFADDAAGWWGAKERLFGSGGDIFSPKPGSLLGGALPPKPGAVRPNNPRDFFARPTPRVQSWPGRSGVAPAPKGLLKISLDLAPGVRARTTGLSADGMDLHLNTGRAMGSVA